MTTEEMKAIFDRDDEGRQFLKFENVKKPLSKRPDLCAFLMLDAALPGGDDDIVAGAEHDIFYLQVDVEKLAEVATEELITDLSRCGVFFDEEFDCLAMYT